MTQPRTRDRNRGQRCKRVQNITASSKRQVDHTQSRCKLAIVDDTDIAATVEGKFCSDKRPTLDTFLPLLLDACQLLWLSGILAIATASHLVCLLSAANGGLLAQHSNVVIIYVILLTLLLSLRKILAHTRATSHVVTASQMHMARNDSNLKLSVADVKEYKTRKKLRTKGGW